MTTTVVQELAKEIKESVSRRLLNYAGTYFDLIHYAGKAYAVPKTRHSAYRVAVPVLGPAMRRHLIRWVNAPAGVPPGELDKVAASLDALAFSGPETPLALRFHHDPGHHPLNRWPQVVIDLGRAEGDHDQCVVIGPDGWYVGPSPSHIAWQRSTTTKPLPRPEPGSLTELAELLSLEPDSEAFRAIVGWVVGLPFVADVRPGLLLVGPPGSGKSTRLRLAASIFEPSGDDALGRAFGRKVDDDEVRALHRAVPLWDNISSVSGQVSDALCTFVTGSAREGRRLYSDAEITTHPIRRAVGLTAVGVPAGLRPDALERLTVCEVPALPARVSDSELQQRFNEAHPRLLGAFCDAIAIVLRAAREELEHPTWLADPYLAGFRMAGHVVRLAVLDNADQYTLERFEWLELDHVEDPPSSGHWEQATVDGPILRQQGIDVRRLTVKVPRHALPSAAEIGLPGGLLEAYAELSRRTKETTAADDSFGGALVALLEARRGQWQGQAAELLLQLSFMPGVDRTGPGWPSSPRRVPEVLNHLRDGLAELGVTWETGLTNGRTRYSFFTLSDGAPAT